MKSDCLSAVTRALRVAALSALVPLLASALSGPSLARADDGAAATATAQTLVDGAHDALTGGGAAADAKLRAAIEEAFAFDIWERFLLGDRAEMLNAEQTAEFRALLPGFLADLYKNQFGKGLDARPEIREAKPARKDVMVRAAIPRTGKSPLPVDWRVRDFGSRGFLVIDVMVGGVSFLVLKREEFAAILDKGGADALLAYMEQNSI